MHPLLQHRHRHIIVFLLILALTLAAIYGQVAKHAFINFDDNLYLYENSKVQAGLSLAGLTWAFSTTHASNWHPVTWLSHMLDCQLFGLNAGWHHGVGALIHGLNAGLLFALLLITTEKFRPSAFVSLLFALHPLHVESVAWASERKDLLSTFFLLLTLLSYAAYSKRPTFWRYCLVMLFFLLGLMSKPMLVSLPFLLLLLDYWPLDRVRPVFASDRQAQCPVDAAHKTFSFLVYEKIPFFLLAVTSCLGTFLVQQQSGAVKSLQMMPLALRISNAVVSYVAYLGKMFYPVDLAVLYPYPKAMPIWMSGGAFLILMSISLLVIRLRRRHPFVIVGWLWYLVAMLPVIGLVQVGVQSMADRYTYIPLIGIFIMISFGISAWKLVMPVLTFFVAVFVFFLLSVLSWRQVAYWKNSILLFEHTLKVTESNYMIHNSLANALLEQGNYPEAEQHYTAALSINPSYLEAKVNLGILYAVQGREEEAYAYFSKAVQRDALNPKIQNNLGNIYKSRGQLTTAVTYYQKALAVAPEDKDALFNLANTFEKQALYPESIALYRKTIGLYPEFAEAFNGLGVALARSGKREESISYFRKALALNPGYAQAEKNLEMTEGKVKSGGR